MIALFDQMPKYCPKCGTEVRQDLQVRYEFFDGVSMGCSNKCGFCFQIAATNDLLELSKKNGDLAKYCS